MGKMKRFFSLMLVLTIVLGSFSSVFAAEEVKEAKAEKELRTVPKDVVGTEYEKAVARLVAFGVLDGYKDGTYRPEQDVTRAEFAKILVEALGIGKAAEAAKGKVTFKDVPASHWASGYVNTASGEGLLKGFPDGTFKPEDQVTYAEALTMLVRAVGYQDEFLKGVWPGSHIAKAAEVGITAGVNFADARGFANRGNVAQVVNNTLDCDVVKVERYKDGTTEYYETDIPLLKDRLSISKYEDTRIVGDKIVNDGLSKDELELRFLKDTPGFDKRDKYSRGDIVKKTYGAGDEETFYFTELVNPREVIGEEVTTYINDDERVIYVERENDDKAYFDYVQKIKNDKLDLVKFDREYDFEKSEKNEKANIAVVYNFKAKDKRYDRLDTVRELDEMKLDDLVGRPGKFVVKNNRIVYAEILEPAEVNDWFVVMKNDDGILEGVSKTVEDFKMDLREDKDYDDTIVFNIKGERLSVKDIDEGNLIYVQEQEYDGDDVAVVTVVQDNKIEGEVGKVKTDRIEVAGKEIKVVNYTKKDQEDKYYPASYSIDDLDEVKLWDVKDEWEDDMEDAYKQDVVAYTDAVGRIAFLNVGGGHSGYKFGIVTRTYADGDRIRIYTSIDGKKGEDIVFKADKERDISVTDARMLNNDGTEGDKKISSTDQSLLGSAVKFRLDSNGEIAKDKFFVMPNEALLMMRDDFGKDLVKAKYVNGDKKDVTFAVNSDGVVVIDAESAPEQAEIKEGSSYAVVGNLDGRKIDGIEVDIDDFSTATWKDIKEDKEDKDIRFYVFPKNSKPEEVDGFVFVGKDGASTGADEEAVYVINKWRSGGDVEVSYVKYPENKVETRIIDEDGDSLSSSIIKKERAYVAKEKSTGKLSIVKNPDDFDILKEVIITEVSGNYIKVDDLKDERLLISGALIYDEDKSKSTSFLEKGMKVDIVYDGVRARVIGYLGMAKDGDKKPPKDGELEGKKVEAVFKSRGNTWMTIDGVDYILSENLVKDNDIEAGDIVDFEFREVDGDKVITSIVKVSEKAKEEAIAKAIAAIKGLPEADNIKLADKSDVEAARALVEKAKELGATIGEDTDKDKFDIDDTKLKAAEAKIDELEQEEEKNAADQKKVDAEAEKLKGKKVEVTALDATTVKAAIEEMITKDLGITVKKVVVENASPEAEVKVTLSLNNVEATTTVTAELKTTTP